MKVLLFKNVYSKDQTVKSVQAQLAKQYANGKDLRVKLENVIGEKAAYKPLLAVIAEASAWEADVTHDMRAIKILQTKKIKDESADMPAKKQRLRPAQA